MDVVLIQVVHASDVWPVAVNAVMNVRVLYKAGHWTDYLRDYWLHNHDYCLLSNIFNPDTFSNKPIQLFFVYFNQQPERQKYSELNGSKQCQNNLGLSHIKLISNGY
jgi:hypothetical protein